MKRKKKLWLCILTAAVLSVASLGVLTACGVIKDDEPQGDTPSGGNPDTKYTLMLSAGDGGTLSQTVYELKAGDSISAVLNSVRLTVTVNGIAFDGWYNGSTKVESGTTMPEKNIYLTARYTTPFTLNEYTLNEDTEKYGDVVTRTGTAFWHEPLNVNTAVPLGEGYEVDGSKQNATTVNSLEIGSTFTRYKRLAFFTIGFNANAPEGSTVEGTMGGSTLKYGSSFTVPASAYSTPEGYRLTGWSTTRGGAVAYHEGETFPVRGTAILYAVWEKGKVDVFGGNDYLFLSDIAGDIYLRRAGFPERKGAYDPDTRLFSFKDGDRTVLEGRLNDAYFYYFRDLQGQSFKYGGEADASIESETLTFGSLDTMTYTVKTADEKTTTVAGSYSVDVETGDYRFEGEGKSFYFSLYVDAEKQNRFVRTSAVDDENGERGFYALYTEEGKGYDTTQAFQLDGMYDELGFASAGIYQLEDGKYNRVITTYYGLESKVITDSEEEGYALTAAAAGDEDFVIIFHDTDGNEVYPRFRVFKQTPFTANGRTFDGVFRLEDGYRGDYGTADEFYNGEDNGSGELVSVTSLSLDGFGNAVYTKRDTNGTKQRISGTYTIKELSAHGATFEYLRLTLSTRESMYVQIMGNGMGVTYYTTSQSEPTIAEIDGSPLKVYNQFTGTESGVSIYDRGFFYIYEGTSVVVYSYFTDVFDGVTEVSVGVDFGIIQSKEGESGVYTFLSALLGSGAPLFDFRYTDDGKIELSLPFTEEKITGEAAETITIDAWGTLTYNGQKFAYGEYSVHTIEKSTLNGTGSWYIREYSFVEKGNKTETVVRVRGDYHETTDASEYIYETLVEDDQILDLVKKRYPDQTDYFDHIYLNGDLPATAEGKTDVDIILTVSTDGESYRDIAYLSGTLTYDPQTELYTLKLVAPQSSNASLLRLLTETYEMYGGRDGCKLKFADFNGKYSAIVADVASAEKYSLDANETADGSALSVGLDGRATYTPKNGTAFTGTYTVLGSVGPLETGTANEKVTYTLIRITADSGDKKLLLFAETNREGAAATYTISEIAASSDAGDYTLMAGTAGYYNIYFGSSVTFFGSVTLNGETTGVYKLDVSEATDNEDDVDLGVYTLTGRKIELQGQTFTEYKLVSLEKTDEEEGSDNFGKALTRYFAVAEVPFGNSSTENGGTAKVFVERLYDVEHFTVQEGGFIDSNGYETPTYQDKEGNIWLGIYGREEIDDSSPKISDYRPTGDHLKDGGQLIFMAQYLANDSYIYDLDTEYHFLFDVVEDEDEGLALSLRDDLTGTLALFEKSELHEETLLYFDGHGGVKYKKDGGEFVDGTFTYDEKTQKGHFESEIESFDFATFTLSMEGEGWNIFVKSTEEYLYFNDDWSTLSLKSYGAYTVDDILYNGVYSDRWGATYYGFYEFLTDELVVFTAQTRNFFFDLKTGNTFEVNQEEFVISEGVLYGYQGATYLPDGLRIPDGVNEIAQNVFSYMYIMTSLDLNKVEKIGYRAFYQTYIGANTLSSEYVTEIGDEAFYTDGTYDFRTYMTAFNFISSIDMPNLKTVGARAFYYANQMRSGTIKLKAVTEIEAQAFMHIVNPDSGTMILDLREVTDLTKVAIHDTAFDDVLGTDSYYNPDNLPPVIILLTLDQREQISGWSDKIKGYVTYEGYAVDYSLAEQGFMDLLGTTYYEFSATSGQRDALPSVTKYSYDKDSDTWTEEKDKFYWGVKQVGNAQEVHLYTESGDALTDTNIKFALDANHIELEGKTLYRTNRINTVSVKDSGNIVDGKEAAAQLEFRFDVQVMEVGGKIRVVRQVLSILYTGLPADRISWDTGATTLTFTILIGEKPNQVTTQVTIDLEHLTATRQS